MSIPSIDSITSRPKPLAAAATGLAASALIMSIAISGGGIGTATRDTSDRRPLATSSQDAGSSITRGHALVRHESLLEGRAPLGRVGAPQRAADAAEASTPSDAGEDPLAGGPRGVTIRVPHSVTVILPRYTPGTAPSATPPSVRGGRPPSVELHDDAATVRFGSVPTVTGPEVTPGRPGTLTGPSACTDTGTCVP